MYGGYPTGKPDHPPAAPLAARGGRHEGANGVRAALRGRLEAGGQASFRALDSLFFGSAAAPDVGFHRRYNYRAVLSLAVTSGS